MKKIIACLLLVFSIFNVSAQPKNVAQPKVVFKTYSDIKEKVSIKYPANWEPKPNPQSVFMFMRPAEEIGQKFRENVNLVVGPAQDLYLIEYLEDARKKMKEQMEGFVEVRSEFIKINGIDFVRMVYQFTSNHLAIKSVLFLTVHHDKAYSLNCTAISTTFDRFIPVFDAIGKSFRFK